MLKRIVNEAIIGLTITTKGPLLIRSGHATVQGPDMTPVLTYRNGRNEPFIPGSSFKGVLRSHSEKIIRTLKNGIACNPFVKVAEVEAPGRDFGDAFCGDKFQQLEKRARLTIGSEDAYRDSCPICRLFGSTEFIGRLAVEDAYLPAGASVRTELRDGVGIDRLTGGAAHGAKFEVMAVSSESAFETRLVLRNFECWQLGLILAVLLDLEEGLIRVGGGRSRGFGSVTGKVTGLKLHQLGVTEAELGGAVWGLGRFLHDGSYGTQRDDLLTFAPPLEWKRHGLRMVSTPSGMELFREAAVQRLGNCLGEWTVPTRMQRPAFASGGGRQ